MSVPNPSQATQSSTHKATKSKSKSPVQYVPVTALDDWERDFLKWLYSFLEEINKSQGKENCDRCALLLNDILTFGLPTEGIKPVDKEFGGLLTYPIFNRRGAIISAEVFDPRVLKTCKINTVIDVMHVEEEGLPESDPFRIHMEPDFHPEPKTKFKGVPRKDLNQTLCELPRRNAAKEGKVPAWNFEGTAHCLINLSYTKSVTLKNGKQDHLLCVVVTPNNRCLFIDPQLNQVYRDISDIPNQSEYRDRVGYLNAVNLPEGFKIKAEPKIAMDEGEDHPELKIKHEALGNGAVSHTDASSSNDFGSGFGNGSSSGPVPIAEPERFESTPHPASASEPDAGVFREVVPKTKPEIIHELIIGNKIDDLKAFIRDPNDLNIVYNRTLVIPTGGPSPKVQINYEIPLRTALFVSYEMVKTVLDLGARVTASYYIPGPHTSHIRFQGILQLALAQRLYLEPRIIDLLSKKALEEVANVFDFNKHFEENRNSAFKMAFLGNVLELKKIENFTALGRGPKNITLLMCAAFGGNIEAINFITDIFLALKKEQHPWFGSLDTPEVVTVLPGGRKFCLLQVAAMGGNILAFEYLLSEAYHSKIDKITAKEAQKTYYDPHRAAIIHGAIIGGHLSMVHFLIERDRKLLYEVEATSGKTTLIQAAERGNEAIFDFLLAVDAQMNKNLFMTKDSQDCTVLIAAIRGKNPQLVAKLLLNISPDLLYYVSKKDTTVTTSLVEAIKQNSKILVQILLAKAKHFINGEYLLLFNTSTAGLNICHLAVLHADVELLKFLMHNYPTECRSLITQVDTNSRRSIVQIAMDAEKEEMVQFLLSKECLDGYFLERAQMIRCTGFSLGYKPPLFEKLVKEDPSLLSATDEEGKTLLMYAIEIILSPTKTFDSEKAYQEHLEQIVKRVEYILEHAPRVLLALDSKQNSIFTMLDNLDEGVKNSTVKIRRASTIQTLDDYSIIEYTKSDLTKLHIEIISRLRKMFEDLAQKFYKPLCVSNPEDLKKSSLNSPIQLQIKDLTAELKKQREVLLEKDKKIAVQEAEIEENSRLEEELYRQIEALELENKRLQEAQAPKPLSDGKPKKMDLDADANPSNGSKSPVLFSPAIAPGSAAASQMASGTGTQTAAFQTAAASVASVSGSQKRSRETAGLPESYPPQAVASAIAVASATAAASASAATSATAAASTSGAASTTQAASASGGAVASAAAEKPFDFDALLSYSAPTIGSMWPAVESAPPPTDKPEPVLNLKLDSAVNTKKARTG